MTREIDRRLAALESRQPDRGDPLKRMTPKELERFTDLVVRDGGLDDECADWDMSTLTDEERRWVSELIERVTS